MPEYQCPDCGGGFPEPKPTDGQAECPWCGTPVDGNYGKDYTSMGSVGTGIAENDRINTPGPGLNVGDDE